MGMQNLGKSGNISLLNGVFLKKNFYEMSTYRISVFHETCKTKENVEISNAKTVLGSSPAPPNMAGTEQVKRTGVQMQMPGLQASGHPGLWLLCPQRASSGPCSSM